MSLVSMKAATIRSIARKLIVCFAAGQAVLTTVLLPEGAHAEEGGGGHYQPGGSASFIDMLAGPGFVYANVSLRYNGSTSASQPLEFGGRVDTNVDATSVADTSAL